MNKERIRFISWYEEWMVPLRDREEDGEVLDDDDKWLLEATTIIYNYYLAEED